MTIITIYALFGDDIRLMVCPVVTDEYFYGVSSFCFFAFLFEIFMASLAQDAYFIGFYFWLDLVATLSLISDIGWIMDPIMGTGNSSSSEATQAQ